MAHRVSVNYFWKVLGGNWLKIFNAELGDKDFYLRASLSTALGLSSSVKSIPSLARKGLPSSKTCLRQRRLGQPTDTQANTLNRLPSSSVPAAATTSLWPHRRTQILGRTRLQTTRSRQTSPSPRCNLACRCNRLASQRTATALPPSKPQV